MAKCKTLTCEIGRHQAASAAIAVVLIAGILIASGVVTLTYSPTRTSAIASNPGNITYNPSAQSVWEIIPGQAYGGTPLASGGMTFWDSFANDYGGGVFGTSNAGSCTAGPIATGQNYIMFYNGTSIYLPRDWFVSLAAVTNQSQPVNYYGSITDYGKPFTVYKNATAWASTILDVTNGAFSNCSRISTGNLGRGNDTRIARSTDTTFSYTSSVTTPYSARFPTYFNPAYPGSGTVSSFLYMILNNTNVYVVSGNATSFTVGNSWTVIIVPLPMLVSGPNGGSVTVQFTLNFPTAQPVLWFRCGEVSYTTLQQLTNAKSTTITGLTAPVGFTPKIFWVLNSTKWVVT